MKKQGIAIILIFTVFAVIFYGYRYLRIPVLTQSAYIMQREDVVSADAYVVRIEAVYSSENTGTMYNYISEGARVAKDVKISTVYRGNVNADLVQELNNIDTKIYNLEKIKAANETFIYDMGSYENKTEVIKNNIINAVIENNISDITEYKNELNALNNDSDDNTDAQMSELIAKKSELESRLNNDKTDIYASMSGVFSTNIDGLEGVLTPDSITGYAVSDFNSIPEPQTVQRTKNTVSAGENICKISDNHTWYVLTLLNKEKAEEIRNKGNVIIRFKNLPGAEVTASYEYMSQEDENEENVVLVLKSDRYLEGVYGIRESEMEIVINRYVGYEIPLYAIRNVQNKQGVVIKIGNSQAFCECNIIYTDYEKGTAIIYPAKDAKRELDVGDKIILGEKTDSTTAKGDEDL